ncbi:MAG: tRNA (adenine-N1)-methyltransferase [Anaerolineales bacterium]|nr:tRNA (adenine-N1)-methyltransferase [Anaerolineales bacterium]
MSNAYEGQLVLLLGKDHKSFIRVLTPGQTLQTHHGVLRHDDLIGLPLGSVVHSHLGHPYYLLTPSWDDLIRDIRRGSQIVYPKDMGYILMKMSVRPGSRIVEAGTGSGALAACFASIVMPAGHVYSYEMRTDMQTLARKNLEKLGLDQYVTLKLRDIADGFDETDADALFLDVPAPWHYLQQAHAALRGGGFFGAILPTANQVIELLYYLPRSNFTFIEVEEIVIRAYKTVPARFRPMDRMVAHTGFLIFARALSPETIKEVEPLRNEEEE